jgi:hypothetical protein
VDVDVDEVLEELDDGVVVVEVVEVADVGVVVVVDFEVAVVVDVEVELVLDGVVEVCDTEDTLVDPGGA